MHRPLRVLAPALTLSVLALIAGPGTARAQTPSDGVLVTVVVTSDREYNDHLIWHDAAGGLRHQADVPLSTHDAAGGRWSSSLTLTAHDTDDPDVGVVLVSGGEYAACQVFLGDRSIAQAEQAGTDASVTCDSRR
ncbi:MAG: hypothetical protein QM662_16315 [Gordonia sp. (in: high G+C Gram-positive bacteria)]